MAQIETFEFSPHGFENVRKYHYGRDWPVVYLLEALNEAYVGQTTNFYNRGKQHYENGERRRLKRAHVITDEMYNKSATLDIEAFLIEHLAAEGSFSLQNKNDGLRNHNYYQRSEYRAKCEIIWKELITKGLVQKEVYEIENSDLFKYSPYKALTEEQYLFVRKLVKDIENEIAMTYVVEGAPGTGKTILAAYLMKYLKDHENTKHLKIALIAPMAGLRGTIQQVFRATSGLKANMVIGPHSVAKESYDLVIVDEAHRLKKRRNLGGPGAYTAFDRTNKELGLPKEATQLDWILATTKQQVLFYDKEQSVLPADIDDVDLRKIGAHFYKLTKQMRIQAGEEYVHFIDAILNQRNIVQPVFKDYELRMFNDVAEMHQAIKDKDKEFGLCRMVAGFAWPWVTKPTNGTPKQDFDIEIDGHKFRWNSKTKDWVNSPNAINEVGCIHTVQGYGMNYVGVIIGPELTYDEEGKKIVVDKSKYCDRNGHAGVTDPLELEQYIINIYRTLLTRGVKGTYIFVVDEKLRQVFSKFISNYKQPILYHFNNNQLSPSLTTVEMVQIPLVGSAPCGNPILGKENIEEYISVPKARLKPGAKYFIVQAEGDSMNLAGIQDGDLLLCRYGEKGETGDKVVALLEGENVTIKEYGPRKDGVRLLIPKSSNGAHKPITPSEGDSVQGIVQEVIKHTDL
ncbi:MAG: DNA/RNA helicase domain-containing protein [Candidatus Spechtbacterales bacterium]